MQTFPTMSHENGRVFGLRDEWKSEPRGYAVVTLLLFVAVQADAILRVSWLMLTVR